MNVIPPNPTPAQPVSQAKPAVTTKPLRATQSLHGDFLEKTVPDWLTDATAQRREALKSSHTVLPAWYLSASPSQRQALVDSFTASIIAQNRLDKTMAGFQDIEAFARPLLIKALSDQHQVQVDVDKTLLCLRRPLEIGVFGIELSSFEFLKLSMLDAALHNFEAYECEAGAYHETSGFVVAGSTPDLYEAVTVNLTVSEFLTLCRKLDIGKQYQTYLQDFFHPADAVTEAALREQFIASQKTAMRAAAEQALLKKDIEAADYTMILQVINGEMHPWIGNKQVWFEDLGLMKKRMTGCVAFSICEKYRYSDEVILYIPHDPEHPLKRYSGSQMKDEFKRLFTTRTDAQATSAEPTEYQRFFSQFVPYKERTYYFSQFTQATADSPSDFWRSPWRTIGETLSPASALTRFKELPPPPAAKLEPAPDPYLAPSTVTRKGHGIWAPNEDLWEYLYKQNRAKVLADARSHAVPTAEVDARAREAKLAHLMQIGLLGLNMVSMFVPVLGEVMMVVMAGQLLYEALEGVVEWGEGDRRAAKDHLIDVAENLAQIALMVGVGAGARKFSAARPVPVIEKLQPVTLPNGQTRLWKPDLNGYEANIALDASAVPNEAGQHVVDGKTCIRQGGRVYEQFFDETLGKWRIKHPTNAAAYQPVLESNGRGAWQHSLERPLEWDRLTLLRRMGHVTEGFSDDELIRIADVSGVSDNALRKMHVDLAVPPPELTDAMRLFKADRETGQVIEQLRGTRPINETYLYALPLMTEMPYWPQDRTVQAFEGPQLSGPSVTYGARHLPSGVAAKAPIRLTRPQILNGELTTRIVNGLDESEFPQLFRGRGTPAPADRAQQLGEQIAEYARNRQPALFDSLYRGTSPTDVRVSVLQRACPGLSEAAAQEVLEHAAADDLERFASTRRVPMRMLEEARWYARQGRQTRAYAGLRSDNMASADSRRLALQALKRLPGWSDTLRLEVRQDSISGALLDSVGDESAADKRYLVKKGAQFQAFNDRGEELNSLSREGDNFYASIMHALPDEARVRLGLPNVSQSVDLQRNIIEQAERHRGDVLAVLEPQARPFKPPVRINATQVGYYASGRGPALNPELTAKVGVVYPDLTPRQTEDFILQHLRAGKSEREIANQLNDSLKEWDTLKSMLEAWVGPEDPRARDVFGRPGMETAWERRKNASRALKRSWRSGPLATENPQAARVEIDCDDPLPTLTVDFSHVRELSIHGHGLTDTNADSFLARFPKLEKLKIGSRSQLFSALGSRGRELTELPRSVSSMTSLKSLSYTSHALSFPEYFGNTLETLTNLEELEIVNFGFDKVILDNNLAPLVKLKKLTIRAPHLTQWPEDTLNLPRLERLNMEATSIHSIPEGFYTGHDKQWAGLSLNWREFAYEDFKRARDYVKAREATLGHLVDLERMERDYVLGELEFLLRMPGEFAPLRSRLLSLDVETVQALSVEYASIFRQFHEPTQASGLRTVEVLDQWKKMPDSNLLKALRMTWRDAVYKRYDLPFETTVFQLPPTGAAANVRGDPRFKTLPELPAGLFPHVKSVRLFWMAAPAAQVRGFVRAFSETQSLEIEAGDLTELPVSSTDLPRLIRLNLSTNRIAVTPEVQRQFNGLTHIEYLNVCGNPLGALDLSALTNLKAVNLWVTGLKTWPTGAENTAGLNWIDLRDNAITQIPSQVLSHEDVLMKTNLTGNDFSPAGKTDLNAALQRIEGAKGLPPGALQRFAQEPVPSVFPPLETGWSVAENLLPLPRQSATTPGAAGFVSRLRDLDSLISPARAADYFSRLRSEGLTDVQIDARLNDLHQTGEALARQLNGWLYIREIHTPRTLISAESRGSAAKQIYRCWQDNLLGSKSDAGRVLDLMHLQTGDLPSLSVAFPGVERLVLTGARITAQGSNGFLSAFPDLTTLLLEGNELTALPDAVPSMARLERLQLNGNHFSDPQTLYRLRGDRLRWLDLSNNQLEEFDASGFSRLESLSLAYNGLHYFPSGAVELEHLQTLDLRGNHLQSFPVRMLEPSRETLVRGTLLDDNGVLSLYSLERLRDYSIARGDIDVMGISRSDLDLRISAFSHRPENESGSGSGSGSGSDSDSDSDTSSDGDDGAEHFDMHAEVEEPENIETPTLHVTQEALDPWLIDTRTDLRAQRTRLWLRLAWEDGNEAFFNLIRTLRDTTDFKLSRAHLSYRLWGVMEAAAENTELRQMLFLDAQTHLTCADGRILAFSEMETRVYTFNALRDVPRQSVDLRGRALLDLSRQLFRLEQVDRLAEAAGIHQDRAEIRLQYRIGMTTGWPDGLELPGQPEHMLYGTPIRGQELIDARNSVLAAEASDDFLRDLVSRDYWARYLTERNPEVFEALEQDMATRVSEVQDSYPDWESDAQLTEQFKIAMNLLEIELSSARNEKMIELSRAEVKRLATVGGQALPQRPSSPQPGPSSRP
ncbi:RING-type E3 ubiquitin transferase [Pseudomonas sp. IT-347P]|uniref:NEL-type E3 ubiquitin ligase domain-containing protein n=1 Tax=Pseudomonas sp. IT-347P TaxID=3026458 RepID=UPI0039E1B51E